MPRAAGVAAYLPVRIWDLPTRVFHWALVALVLGMVVTAKIGGNALVWHARLGAVVLALLVFRLLWGWVGGWWSRFAAFVHGPATVLGYLRGDPAARPAAGHNPLGGWSVVAMLVWLLLQLGTGLVADDEIAFVGPLNHWVSTATGLAATAWHKGPGQWGLIALVVVHIAAVVWHTRRGQQLLGPMWHGDQMAPAGTRESEDHLGRWLFALFMLSLGAALAAWVFSRAP